MNKYLLFVCAVFLLACENPYIADVGEDDESVAPGDGKPVGEVLWAENDTARFYLSPIEIKDVMLFDHPTPSVLIKDPRYRFPRKLEVSDVLKNADLPTGYWQSRQRILCHDDEREVITPMCPTEISLRLVTRRHIASCLSAQS